MRKRGYRALLVWVALLGVLGPAWGQGQAVTLVSATGPATIRRTGTTAYTPAARKMTLGAGDIVRTGAGGGAILLFPDGSEIKVRANSAVVIPAISGVGAPERVRLESGQIWVRMTRGKGARFEAGRTAVAGVRGTEFDLQLAANETATLSVVEGEVRFANEKGAVLVADAQQSVARLGEAPSAPVTVNLPVILEWTNALLPVVLVKETAFVSQDPAVLKQAAEEATRLRAPGPRHLRLGDILHDQGKLTEALAEYDRAQPLAPADDGGWGLHVEARRAQTLLELGRLDESEASFRRILTATPNDIPARAGMAMTLLALGRLDEARAQVATLPPNPGTSTAQLSLALVEIRRGALPEADAALDRALALDRQNAQAHAWKSFVLRTRNDLPSALTEARHGVDLAPYSSITRQSLAATQLLLGQAAEARKEARQAVALDPLSSAAHVSLANAALLQGDVPTAVREAQAGVTLDAKSDRAQYTLGAAYAEERNYRRSERHLRRSVELNADLLDARSLLARVLILQGERAEAERVAQGTLERNPNLSSARASLGQVYRVQGRLRDAAREYEAALALSPRSGLYHLEVARVYLDLNDLPKALSHALTSVFVLPGSSEAHAILGLVYDRQDNGEQAVREYLEAISLAPDNSLARLGVVTAFAPRARELYGSGRPQLRERAQALLRDPAVLQQVFEPGVTSEVAVGLGGDSREQQQFLHRGQFARGRVNDLTVLSRGSDDGYRDNSSASFRGLQSDIAVQATPDTAVLLQLSSTKNSLGLPEAITQPDLNNYSSDRRNEYNVSVRQNLGPKTQLWLKHGYQSIRVTRTDPDAIPQLVDPSVPEMGLYKINQRFNWNTTEARLDHRIGSHRLTYGAAYFGLNSRLFDLHFALPGASGRVEADPTLALEIQGSDYIRDYLHYLQDEYRISGRASLILGAQMQRLKEQSGQRLVAPLFTPPGESVFQQDLFNEKEGEHDLLPYGELTYRLDARNLIRLMGNKTKPRPGDALLAPSEAFIVGEPISIYVNAGPLESNSETYELDYEHRFSQRTFGKLFYQRSLARGYTILNTLDQQLISNSFQLDAVKMNIIGMRFEHQINRHLSSFTRLSYWEVEDQTPLASGPDPNAPPGSPFPPNPSFGLQAPFSPKWRALVGLNYVDRSGTKVQLTANYVSRRFTDVGNINFADPDEFGSPTFDPNAERASINPRLLLNLRIAKEPSVRTEYALAIVNITNTTWPDNRIGFPTRGRTWLVTLARRF